MDAAGFSVDVKDIAGVGDSAEVTVHGPLDAKSVLPFKTRMQSLTDRGVRRLLLHMDEVKYINSTGIACLINLSESLREGQGAVALVGVQPKVKIILDTMGVTEFFRVHAAREAALRDLKSLPAPAAAAPKPAPAPVRAKPAGRTTTVRREGSSTKTGRLSPPTDVPPKKSPNIFARFFRRLFGR